MMVTRVRSRSRRAGPGWGPRSALVSQRALELALVHVRTAVDVPALGLFVELIVGGALGALAGPLAAPLAGGHVLGRGTAGGLGLAGPGAFLVHRAGGDLLGPPGALAPVLRALLDVLVLAFPLGARTAWHVGHSFHVR